MARKPPHRLLIATGNPGKLREFRALFDALEDGDAWELIAPADVGMADFEVAEDGETHIANAARKARSYAHAARMPALLGVGRGGLAHGNSRKRTGARRGWRR